MNTYREQISQFVVEYHEELPAEHRAQYRINGVDPDTVWNLKWSFTQQQHAEDQCRTDQRSHDSFCAERSIPPWKTFRVRDMGAPVEVEREAWF